MADVNALALATALVLLLTSGAAFHRAEESTQEVAWQRLLSDTNSHVRRAPEIILWDGPVPT